MIDFSEILPVGMVAHGGQIAQAMAYAAQNSHNTPNWEAFHYERLSGDRFELTGGIVNVSHGGKRWLEPHDSIIISHAQIIAAFYTLFPEQQDVCAPTLPLPSQTDHATLETHEVHLHLTLKLPEDAVLRENILKACHLNAHFLGAQIIACHLQKNTSIK